MRAKKLSIIHLSCITTALLLTWVGAFSPNALSSIHSRRIETNRDGRGGLIQTVFQIVSSNIETVPIDLQTNNNKDNQEVVNIVLLAGFESFNKELYTNAAASLPPDAKVNLQVFADSEIRTGASIGVGGADAEDVTNPKFVKAMKQADIFIGSLIFDYEDVVAVEALMDYVLGPRLLFECATELMTYNRVGSFSMAIKDGEEPAGPPPAIKAVLSKFSSGKEEDKISGYLKLLKM